MRSHVHLIHVYVRKRNSLVRYKSRLPSATVRATEPFIVGDRIEPGKWGWKDGILSLHATCDAEFGWSLVAEEIALSTTVVHSGMVSGSLAYPRASNWFFQMHTLCY